MILISCTDVELEENCIVNEANQNEKIEAVVMINDEVLNDEAINQVIITQHIFAPGYESFEEMVESSDLIIRGHVLDERLEWFNTNITLEAAINARTEEYEAGLISRELLDIEIEHYHNNLEDFEPSYEYVIFYRIEILEIFQGEYEVGDVIELREFMGRDEEWNQSLEHSKRYEVDTELIFFLRRSRNLGSGYFVFFPHQAVYELPIGLRYETSAFDEHVLLKPLDVFQPEPLEVLEGYVIICDGFHAPFDINLNMLREIAEENGIAN